MTEKERIEEGKQILKDLLETRKKGQKLTKEQSQEILRRLYGGHSPFIEME